MNAFHSLLVFLHVLSISIWIAAALWVAGDVKRSLGSGKPNVDLLNARVRPALALDWAAALATIVTGALLVWEERLGMPRVGISAGILLTLVRLGVLAALHGQYRSIATRLESGETVPVTDPAARRMSMLSGIAHTMWLLALAGMVFPI